MKKITLLLTAACGAIVLTGCCGNKKNEACTDSTATAMKAPYQKKYTNADFYDAQGVFNQEVAKQAMKEMIEHYGVDYNKLTNPAYDGGFWVADFGMGDFEHCGMGGVVWANDSINGYFAHGIYLLPGQMIPEHKHLKTKFPAKCESWLINFGSVYNFSELGEPTADAPAIPASQAATTISKNFIYQTPGDFSTLKALETYHFLMGGPNGVIVTEFGNYHDWSNLQFSNPKSGK